MSVSKVDLLTATAFLRELTEMGFVGKKEYKVMSKRIADKTQLKKVDRQIYLLEKLGDLIRGM